MRDADRACAISMVGEGGVDTNSCMNMNMIMKVPHFRIFAILGSATTIIMAQFFAEVAETRLKVSAGRLELL